MESARSDNQQVIEDMLLVYSELLIPFMKVRRDLPFPTESERQETDGEHAFTLSMMAITLAEKLELHLDTGLIAQFALVHDLVEAYAGDTSARASQDEHDAKVTQEHEAFLDIEKRFQTAAPWIGAMIMRYEARTDEEARFVYVVDKLMGSFVWLAGGSQAWAESYPEHDGSGYHAVVKRLRVKAQVYPGLLELFDALHDHLDKQWPHYLKTAGEKS